MANVVAYLSQEEHAYIQQLFADRAAERDEGIELIAPEPGRDWFLGLLSHMRAELVANDGRYTLRFALEVEREGPGMPARMRLSLPTVTDCRGIERSARVRPLPNEIEVVDGRGRLGGAQVMDISHSGLALVVPRRTPSRAGARFSGLQIRLPEHEPIEVNARVVRVQADGRGQCLGLTFENIGTGAQQALKHYIFDRYPAGN